MRHTVVISDVHLCEAEPGDDLWMRWRQRPYFPDQEFANLVDALLAEAHGPGDVIELVFNGDLFDFDAGRVIDGHAVFEDLPRTESYANELIDRILADHPGYVAALAKLLRGTGHRAVFVSGNHDPQLLFEGVRYRIRETLARVAGDPTVAERVLFRAWFHHTPDGVHVEHGNQYDPYCSFRYAMLPHRPIPGTTEPEIQPTVGSIAFRNMASRMGYFNPHVDSSFLLSFPQYVAHWTKHYLFSRRDLIAPFATGLASMFRQLIERRDPGTPERAAENLRRAAEETGADPARIARHVALCAPPAEDALHTVAREFWVDRFLLGFLCGAAVATPIFVRNKTAVGIAVGMPALFAAYEYAIPRRTLDDNWSTVAAMTARIAEIYDLRAVVFGHTHIPYGAWKDSVFHGNTGTWTAAYRDLECNVPVDPRGKPVIWLRSDGPRMEGGLYRWNGAHLLPDFSADDDARVEDIPLPAPAPA
jgi:UDP-2,3-diacylglucosamine pyrophosphatase LpxH